MTADRISMPVLAQLVDRGHFVLVAQAASYGTYVIPNFKRAGNTLAVSFPMDQKEPVRTSLPFASPWRFVIVSPGNVGRIVESVMPENLNPPTEPALRDAAWIRPGRASWDFIAGDGKKLGTWIDFDVEMGWEWHVTDAGWQNRTPDMAETTAYAKARNVAIMAWGKVANRDFLYRRDRADAWMAELARLGIRGAKIDFFDQRDSTATATDDYEDTQARLQLRDFLSETAAKYHLMVEYHGAAIPSGERRRWPNLASAEAVYGLERRVQNLQHDLTIPYVRNVMGPVSYTPFHLQRSIGSLAYQLGQSVIYEAGIQIFAERYDRILGFSGVDFLKALPSTWDDTRFVDGVPVEPRDPRAAKGGRVVRRGDHARRAHGERAALVSSPRGRTYEAEIYRDGADKTALVIDKQRVKRGDVLTVPMLAAGGSRCACIPRRQSSELGVGLWSHGTPRLNAAVYSRPMVVGERTHRAVARVRHGRGKGVSPGSRSNVRCAVWGTGRRAVHYHPRPMSLRASTCASSPPGTLLASRREGCAHEPLSRWADLHQSPRSAPWDFGPIVAPAVLRAHPNDG